MFPDGQAGRAATSGIYSLLSNPDPDPSRTGHGMSPDDRRGRHVPGTNASLSPAEHQRPIPYPVHAHPSPYAAAPTPTSDNQIASILMRLSDVERRLDTIRPAPHPGTTAAEIAATRSLLVPAAQGGSRGQGDARVQHGDTPVYDDRHRTHHDVMESLCLRRDLSRPEDPPFGMWWTFTVEETLLWPVLGYEGSVNKSLDVVMLGAQGDSDGEDDHEDGHGDEDMVGSDEPCFVRRRADSRRGLDDGTVVPELIGHFLRNVHTKCPMLDPDKLREHAAGIIENGLGWDARSCQVLLACALGAISSTWDSESLDDYSQRHPSPERYAMAQEYFAAGQKRLGPLCTRSSLTSAQCLFMAGTYFMFVLRPVAGWRLLNAASIACRTYISKRIARESFGLRHDGSRSMEQRLYWSCFKAEREVACEFGMETTGLNVVAYSTSLPTPPSGYTNTMSHGAHASPELSGAMPHEAYDDRSWYFFLTDIMLRKLEMRIDTYCQEKRREAYRRAGDSPEAFYQSIFEAMSEFDYQLTSYHDSLPPVMRFPLDELRPCPDELRQHLRCRLSSVRHDIYMPFFYALLAHDVHRWSPPLLRAVVDRSSALLRLDVAFLWAASYTHRDHNTWLALRRGVRAGLVLTAARRLKASGCPGAAGLQVPDDETCRQAAQALVRGLEYWRAESRDCATNLEMLRSLHPDFR